MKDNAQEVEICTHMYSMSRIKFARKTKILPLLFKYLKVFVLENFHFMNSFFIIRGRKNNNTHYFYDILTF